MKGNTQKREGIVLLLGAVIYAALYALLSQIDEAGTCAAGEAARRFCIALPVALAVLALLLKGIPLAMGKRPKHASDGRKDGDFCTAGAYALIFLAYVPQFLVFYPGSFMYDTQRQTFQIAGNAYDTFHPLLHTLMIRFCLSFSGLLGSFEKCAALYSLLQMLLLSLCFALVCASMARVCSRNAGRRTLAFFMLYPTHAAMASNCIKDVLFSGFFALFVMLCTERVACGRLPRRRAALHVLAGALACLLRNNMIYAMLVWAALLALVCLVQRGRARDAQTRFAAAGLFMATALSMALGTGVNAGLAAVTDAAHGSVAEMLSVPIQQLARAVWVSPESFDEGDMALMDALFPKQEYLLYEPTLSDPVKNGMDTAFFSEHVGEAAALWARIGLRCPGVYVDAFLNLALPSLYPYSEYRVAQPYIEVGLQNHVLTGPFAQPDMSSPVRFEGLRTWLDEHIWRTGADDVPAARLLFNTGAVFWLCGLCVLAAAFAGEWRRLLVLALPVLLYMTYLLGPVMQGRYLYPFVCILPVLLAGLGALRPQGQTKREGHDG
ncbi:MAG: DUF6020 family protein [Clostridiales bacterium]|nr:DUF6020 family protein [Clostridiales bacterium]